MVIVFVSLAVISIPLVQKHRQVTPVALRSSRYSAPYQRRLAADTHAADVNLSGLQVRPVLLEKGDPSGDRLRNVSEKFPLLPIRLVDHYLNAAEFPKTVTIDAIAGADNEHVIV